MYNGKYRYILEKRERERDIVYRFLYPTSPVKLSTWERLGYMWYIWFINM